MISLRDVVTGFGNRDPLAAVWRRSLRGGSAVITGVPPLRYIGNGRPLTDYLISGNAVQDGTPSPDAPVDATGSGVRTRNLFDAEFVQGGVLTDGGITNATSRARAKVYVRPNETYSFSCNAPTRIIYAYGNDDAPIRIMYDDPRGTDVASFTAPEGTAYVWICVMNEGGTGTILPSSVETPMLNLGSTALPYEPYGYKLPLTVNGTEYPIYLGTVPTTRRVKKLVLTGEEQWNKSDRYIGSCYAYLSAVAPDAMPYSPIVCTHASNNAGAYLYGNGRIDNNSLSLWLFDTTISPANFKSYLAAQYANGTPVTIWYVLVEPETAVVNEPLMKIGDYADTISSAQAQVTMPTVSGENILDVPTEVKPSEITIKGGISSV